MDKAGLLKEISVAISKPKALALAETVSDAGLVHELIDLTFGRDKRAAFRAAWILEDIALQRPGAFEPEIAYFISRYPEQPYQSCRRHFAAIMMKLTGSAGYARYIAAADMEAVVEATFEWLTDPLSAIAVQANCMDVLLNLKSRYDWIAEELQEQVLFLMRSGGAAIQSRGRKILAELNSIDFQR